METYRVRLRLNDQQLELIEKYGGIDALGGDHSAPHVAAAWAWAGNTPFQWGKQMASHLGGTRNPLVVAWPDRIKPGGDLRAQFTHCIDVGPTILDDVRPDMSVAREEIFGPVASMFAVHALDDAVDLINASPYGNAATIYTSSGKDARDFRYRVHAGNIGINVGVAAPMAYFPFGGMKNSFFGDLHPQSRDAVRFFTESKVVITRWV